MSPRDAGRTWLGWVTTTVRAVIPMLFLGLGTSVFAVPLGLGTGPLIEIAIREDAAPFAWVEQKGDEPASYHGFLWKVCLNAVDRAHYRYNVTKINAEQRKQLLTDGHFQVEGISDRKQVNLLCDPTTITLARLRNFDDPQSGANDLEFSPIVFIANGSYVRKFGAPPLVERKPGMSVDKFCSEQLSKRPPFVPGQFEMPVPPHNKATWSTREDGKRRWWLPRLWPRPQPRPDNPTPYEIWGYVEGTTIGDEVDGAIGRVNDRVICPEILKSHQEAAWKFCAGGLHRYFGDIELIKAALATQRKMSGNSCAADLSQSGQGTYEPYAFVLSSAHGRGEFPERFSKELYSMFEDGTIDRIFLRHFVRKSEYLDILFRINSVPQGHE